jgi:transcriptional regulator with XRE-family HTH domain
MMAAMENITSYRSKHGLSREQFGALIGVSAEMVRLIERGLRPITPERAVQLEAVTAGELTRQALRPDIFGDGSGGSFGSATAHSA